MTNEHPIQPSLELMERLRNEAQHPWIGGVFSNTVDREDGLIRAAFRAGANKQLEQCLDWFKKFYKGETWMLRDLRSFRLAMRPEPNPPTVKEALQALDSLEGFTGCLTEVDTIRRTLKNLNGQN